MDFGKAGKRVSRTGWNGKSQYIELATCVSYKNAAGEIIKIICRVCLYAARLNGYKTNPGGTVKVGAESAMYFNLDGPAWVRYGSIPNSV